MALTDEQIWELAANCLDSVAGRLQFARAIESAACADRDARIAKAEQTLIAAGYTDEGGELWKPPLGPSASPLLDRIAHLEATASANYGRGQADAHSMLSERIAEQDETLRFVERWANHHGTKPNMTPEEALSCIQHYPAIRAITHGYVDGQMPETPNPWKQLRELQSYVASLEQQLSEARKDAERYRWLRDVAHPDDGPAVAEHQCNDWGKWYYSFPSGTNLDSAIDAAMKGQQ